MVNSSDLATLNDEQLRALEHYSRLQRLRRERGEAIVREDFVSWAKATLKIGVEYIDYAWNWLLNQFGLR